MLGTHRRLRVTEPRTVFISPPTTIASQSSLCALPSPYTPVIGSAATRATPTNERRAHTRFIVPRCCAGGPISETSRTNSVCERAFSFALVLGVPMVVQNTGFHCQRTAPGAAKPATVARSRTSTAHLSK
jgi:hypothetical protein